MKIDTNPCREAADLINLLSADLPPTARDEWLNLANQLRVLPVPFETESFRQELRSMFGETLVYDSLILTAIGKKGDFSDVDEEQAQEMQELYQHLDDEGLLASAQKRQLFEECALIGEKLGEVGVRIMDAPS